MLSELRKHRDIGSRDEILYFLKIIVGKHMVRINDIYTLCCHAPGQVALNPKAVLDFCTFIEITCFTPEKNECYLDLCIRDILENDGALTCEIVNRTLKVLFEFEILKPEHFTFKNTINRFVFNNHLLQLDFAAIRNVLISLGFITIHRDGGVRIFVIDDTYEKKLATFIGNYNNKISLAQLQKKLKQNEETGNIAELYVMDYEAKRLMNSQRDMTVRRISEIDVLAGYDIASYESALSVSYDRFIEVKAASENEGFYWSINEINSAKFKKEQYYLYLVDLRRINNHNYAPTIIKNPAKNILDSGEWFIETQSFFIKRI
jgi:hypothetical protein